MLSTRPPLPQTSSLAWWLSNTDGLNWSEPVFSTSLHYDAHIPEFLLETTTEHLKWRSQRKFLNNYAIKKFRLKTSLIEGCSVLLTRGGFSGKKPSESWCLAAQPPTRQWVNFRVKGGFCRLAGICLRISYILDVRHWHTNLPDPAFDSK